MARTLDLADHIVSPEGGVPATLQHVAQDLHDLECLENELQDICDQAEELTPDAQAFLQVASQVTQGARVSLGRALCTMTLWAKRLGEPTSVTIDDTVKKILPSEEFTAEVSPEVIPNTKPVGGKN